MTNYQTLRWIFAVALLWPGSASALSLHERYSPTQMRDMFSGAGGWHPFPTAGERAGWENISPSIREHFITAAEKALEQPVPVLPASVYLQYRRHGNRDNYQQLVYARRLMLRDLVIAECLEGDGRFLDPIADVLWATCEESSWTWPAHIHPQKAGVGLPDVDDPVVALFSAEAGTLLAWTWYLLKPQLDTISPLIARRVEREVQARILTPFLEREFGWMGFTGGRPNNWNPWINSNVLACALLMEKDGDRRLALLDKILRSLDRFLIPYPDDGSCDEGPSYWGHAGGSLFDALDLLYRASNGRFDVWDEPIVGEIGRFIYRTHINDDYFINLGDCSGRIHLYRDVVWRYGDRIGDPAMKSLAAHGATMENLLDLRFMNRTLHAIFNAKNVLADAAHARPPMLANLWLSDPDMQLMAARDQAGEKKGWFVAAWGGHNAQSHNHNDVGNVLLFVDGKPVLIDAGKPTYTRQTFSSRRYEIWVMQSDYHNCPTINGEQQQAGRRYAAGGVRYRQDGRVAELSMDLANAYPAEANVVSWRRTARLARGREFTLTDAYELSELSGETALNLLTPRPVRWVKEGLLVLMDEETQLLRITYDAAKLRFETETILLDDPRLTAVWGPELQRIRLVVTSDRRKDALTLKFAPATP